MKTCEKIEDLICENCIHVSRGNRHLFCKFSRPLELTFIPPSVTKENTCGSGMWYWEFRRTKNDRPGPPIDYQVVGKAYAVSNFMNYEREQSDSKESEDIQNKQYERLESFLQKIGELSGVKQVDCIGNFTVSPKSVFLTDRTIEFTVKAYIERRE